MKSNKTLKILILLILNLCLTKPGYAAPKGAVKLGPDKLFQVGSIYCGYINGTWIPGRKLSGDYFYSRAAERKDVLKKAKNAPSKLKAKLKKKAKNLLSKKNSEGPTCLVGPTPTPTPTTTPMSGSSIVLSRLNDSLYYTEHSLFIIPTSGQVDFNSSTSWDSVYSTANIDSYLSTLRTAFPDDYFFLVIAASNLLPDRVPNVLTYRQFATGIGEDTLTDPTATNICRYNIGSSVGDGAFAVLDHEFGHNFGVFLGSALGDGHWLTNSNAEGQMADNYSDDGFLTVKRIQGSPGSGFTWTATNNDTRNETEIFSDRDLYLQGLNATFPSLYVLNTPVYNSDGTMSYGSVSTYDQNYVVTNKGVRSPSYQTSPKRFRVGFVYIARDATEIEQNYLSIERSIRHFVYAEEIDTGSFRFQVPYIVLSKNRASIDARLADLDGNTAPTLSITGATYLTSSSGSVSVPFVASDTTGDTVTVSCVPNSANCAISGSNVSITGLTAGTYFFTIKAEDSGGKKVFAHFVVDES